MNQTTYLLLSTFVCTGLSALGPVTWEGDDVTNPSYYGVGANWDTGSVPPFLTYLVFPTGVTQQVIEAVNSNGTSRFSVGIEGINFETAGYVIQDTIGAGTGGLRYDFNGTAASTGSQPFGINSSGAGVNEISATFQISSSNVPDTGQPTRPITVGAGNTLLFSGDYQDGQAWSLLGDGRMVVNNTTDRRLNSFNAGLNLAGNATLLNRGNMQIAASGLSLTSGEIAGDGIFYGRSSADVLFNGTTLAPGGDGTAIGGPEAGSLTWMSGLAGSLTRISIGGASTFEAYIGPGGTSDLAQLLLDLDGGNLDIESGATLNIIGSAIQDGTYVIISDIDDSNPITGTFSNVLFNGAPINPSNFTVNYNADFVSVDVSGIPEPSTYALIVGLSCGALLVIRRRRR